jgi:feruloyl esterase
MSRSLRRFALLCTGAAALGIAGGLSARASESCSVSALNALKIPHVTIATSKEVAAEGPAPAHCDVMGSVTTNGEGAGPNSANFEIKLPEKWNRKFVFFGVGGLAGSLRPSANPEDFASSLGRGFATAITDTGHVGKGPFDPTWILAAQGKPNQAKVVDYFYRAPHQVTVAAKALVAGYYSAPKIDKAYFDGCSFGGHMGMMEAMRYPDDYDGIVAGAPYIDNHTVIWSYKDAKAFLNAYIPRDLVAKINDAVLASCDAADGTKDGLIQNPAKCSFDPQSLVPDTLSKAQADAFQLFMRATTDADGHVLYPGSSVSDLAAADGPAGGFMGWVESVPPVDAGAAEPWGDKPPVLWAAAEGFTKYFVLRDPQVNLNADWPVQEGRIADKALRQFDQRLGFADVDQPERLGRFFAQGKKLLLYHGYGDTAISPFRTVWFYEDLAKRMGGYAKAREQVRLFMVPGMLHCYGGDGPNAFDTLSALDAWVEQGKAPDAIVAAKFPENKRDKPATRTMPLCAFPEQARYSGSGDVNAAANWNCPANDRSQLDVGAAGIVAGMGPGRK